MNRKSLTHTLYRIVTSSGYRGLITHRLANYMWRHNFKRFSAVLAALNETINHVQIHPNAQLDPTTVLVHGHVFIGDSAVIGPNCSLFQNTTIGSKSYRPEKKNHATLEHDVVVCTGAVLLGPIVIGHHSVIGPNCVVTRNVPPWSMVTGNPARIFSRVPAPSPPAVSLESEPVPAAEISAFSH